MKNLAFALTGAAVFVFVSYGVKTSQVKEVYLVCMLLSYIGCFFNLQFVRTKGHVSKLADIIANVWFTAGLCSLSIGALYGIRIIQEALKTI